MAFIGPLPAESDGHKSTKLPQQRPAWLTCFAALVNLIHIFES